MKCHFAPARRGETDFGLSGDTQYNNTINKIKIVKILFS